MRRPTLASSVPSGRTRPDCWSTYIPCGTAVAGRHRGRGGVPGVRRRLAVGLTALAGTRRVVSLTWRGVVSLTWRRVVSLTWRGVVSRPGRLVVPLTWRRVVPLTGRRIVALARPRLSRLLPAPRGIRIRISHRNLTSLCALSAYP